MILDTNALSSFAEGKAALKAIVGRAGQIAIPVIVLAEYRYGVSQSRKRKRYEQWLSEYLPTFRILTVDEETALPYVAVRSELKKAGTPIPSNDIWIAALCRQHNLPLVSRDQHFDSVPGLQRLSW